MVDNDLTNRLRDFGFTEAQADILLTLNREGHILKKELEAETGYSHPVIEETVDQFEDVGWLEKTDEPVPDGEMGRARRGYRFTSTLTQVLQDVIQGMRQHANEIEDQVE